MDKIKEFNTNINHSFSVSERKNINISGIIKIYSFNKNEFVIETILGIMHIMGDELEVVKLDTYQGNIVIKGKIDSISYDDKKKDNSIFNRLFK